MLYRNSDIRTARQAEAPAALRPATLRLGLVLAVIAALASFALRAEAQPTVHAQPMAPVPFTVGEELVFHAKFGVLPAGTARMRVDGIDTIRGRAAYHVVFSVDGGIPLFRVHDRYESWMDVETLSSLRHVQHVSEGRYHRNTTYEIMPELSQFQKNEEAPQASVANPLDDGSFIYAVRAAGIRVGDTLSEDRYFIPDRNPVILSGVRVDTVTVGAGTFTTTVVRPTIKSRGIFSEAGEAQVWFTNDARRLPVLLKTHFSRFSLTLSLTSVTYGNVASR